MRLITLLLIVSPLFIKAQSNEEVYAFKDLTNYPQFEGGVKYLDTLFHDLFVGRSKMDSNFTYGTVELEFVVNKDGKITDIKVKRDEMPEGFATDCIQTLKEIAGGEKYEVGKIKRKTVAYKKSEEIQFYRCKGSEKGYVYTIGGGLLVRPEYPGGQEEMDKYVRTNFEVPSEAIIAKASGKIYIEYWVTEEGKVENIKILKDGVGYGCAEELKRIIEEIAAKTTFKPGTIEGCPIRTSFVYPIVINQN